MRRQKGILLCQIIKLTFSHERLLESKKKRRKRNVNVQSSLLRLHIFKVKGCLKWNLFFLIYRSCLHLALHSSLTTCVYLLFKRKRLTIAVLLQNCPVYAVLPGGEEPFILASSWHPTPAARRGSCSWVCVQKVALPANRGRGEVRAWRREAVSHQGRWESREGGREREEEEGRRIEQWQWSLFWWFQKYELWLLKGGNLILIVIEVGGDTCFKLDRCGNV